MATSFAFFRPFAWIILAIYASYWALTLFFVMPDNYLRIKALRAENFFDLVFFQRWAFFAPPPTFNDRLFYEFTDIQTGRITSFEVLESMQKRRQQQYLRNNDESVLDYILSNTVNTLQDVIREGHNLYRARQCPQATNPADCYEQFLRERENAIHQTAQMRTLRNYGLLIMARQNVTGVDKMRISIGHVPIPRFADRYKTLSAPQVRFTMRSVYYNLTTKRWEL